MWKRIKGWFAKRSVTFQLYCLPGLRNLLALITMLFSVISAWLEPLDVSSWNAFWESAHWIQELAAVLGLACIVLSLMIWVIDRTTRLQYERTKKAEELAAATLKALQEIDETKTRKVIRITYGRVNEWNPLNYTKNVLTYDVHEHIRTILYALRDLILENTEGLTRDQVCVDFVYCYPKEECYNGELPIPAMWQKKGTVLAYADGDDSDKSKLWRLITSGSHSLGGSIQGYLGNGNTFFRHVDVMGYCFYNDKEDIPTANYQFSLKDGVWKARAGSAGSIIGLVIELKNDEPEATFVKGILTINTFGRPLYNKRSEAITEKDFDKIFFEKVVLSFKQLIMGELAQMFIRHSIKDGEMCPVTGEMDRTLHQEQGSQKTVREDCALTGRRCIFNTAQDCPYCNQKTSSP